uniref:KxDL domain-containing protein n=1 Tax=Parastrongyloides trichosuri TaxID=131310 RepID=A0A0N4Z4P8_PARTI
MNRKPNIPPLNIPEPSVNINESQISDNSPVSDNEDVAREESVVQCLLSQVDEGNITEIISFQKKCLERLEKTNAMLENCQRISEVRLTSASKDIAIGKVKILEIKNELEYIIRKIIVIKKTLKEKYPEEFLRAG